MMQIRFSDEGERLVAQPKGRLEAGDGGSLAAAVEQHLQDGTRQVTLDLDGLEYIGFGGIRAILRMARSLKSGGRNLDFVNGNEAVREALDLAGLDDIFPFTPPYVSSRGNQHESRTP